MSRPSSSSAVYGRTPSSAWVLVALNTIGNSSIAPPMHTTTSVSVINNHRLRSTKE